METELITRYLEASLAPLFEDLGKEIMFRWYANVWYQGKESVCTY